jgi:hypothetical protein
MPPQTTPSNDEWKLFNIQGLSSNYTKVGYTNVSVEQEIHSTKLK